MISGIFSRAHRILLFSIAASIIFGSTAGTVTFAQTRADESENSTPHPNAALQQKLFVLHKIDPQSAAAHLSLILKIQFGNIAYPENEQISFVPIPEKNWLVARAPVEAMGTIKEIITKIESGYPPNKIKDTSPSEVENKNNIVEKFFFLTYISPAEAAGKIEPLLSGSGYLRVEEDEGTILVTDRAVNLLEVEKLIKKIDVPDIHADDPMVNVNLSQLDINDIVRILAQWTGKSIIPSEEAMNLTLTVFSPSKMRRDKAIRLIYTVMRENGFIAQVTDKVIYIKPAPCKTCGYTAAPLLGPDESLETIQDETALVRKVFKLNYYNPSAMGQTILPFLDSYGYLMADESTKNLMVMDNVETLILVEQLIRLIDRPDRGNLDNNPAKK